MDDKIKHPSHYCFGDIETIDCIESLVAGRSPTEAYCFGNAIKYIARAGRKDGSSFEDDCKKAMWYIQRALSSRKE